MISRDQLQAALDLYDSAPWAEDEPEDWAQAFDQFAAAARSWLRLLPDQNGQWDEDLVDVVAAVLSRYFGSDLPAFRNEARAVLSALVGEGE